MVVPLLALLVVTIAAPTIYISVSLAGSSDIVTSLSLRGLSLILLAADFILGGVSVAVVYWVTTGSRLSLDGA